MTTKLSNIAKLLSQASDKFLSICTAQQQSSQPGDIYKAIFDSKVFGLKGSDREAEFDVNSKAADVIFNTMDTYKFKGEVSISVNVDNKGTSSLTVTCSPASPKLADAINKAFSAGVQAAVKKVAPPANTVTLPNVVVAKNA